MKLMLSYFWERAQKQHSVSLIGNQICKQIVRKAIAQIMYIFKAYPYLLRPCETVSLLSTFYYHYNYHTTRKQ